MTDFKINQYLLDQEAISIAKMAMVEEKEYGTDPMDYMHQVCDGHQWVIYTYKAMMLCAECDTSDGEDYIDELGMTEFDDLAHHASMVAFATLLGVCHEAYAELN